MDLKHILKRIPEKLFTPEGEAILAEAGLVAGSVNPIAGLSLETINLFLQRFDNIKLRFLLKGLANDILD